jgi:6-pyruvoyltetrahydropterin/6-carboxytetrahydropterin synthase
MAFVVEVERAFRAVQGLRSPVRARRGLSLISPAKGIDVILVVGIAFADDQLTDDGRFFDTDLVAEQIQGCCDDLAERTWTELFDFPPTFELVARHVFDRLSAGIAGLAYVELRDKEFNVRTRYIAPAGHG